MEHAGEGGAQRVTVLHVAHRGNRELMEVTSPALRQRFPDLDLHQLWTNLVRADRFVPIEFSRFVGTLVRHAPQDDWAEYMNRRYVPAA
jgi:hypothetical protein